MNVVSFDIFDTCLVRKCGTPECFFDILSLRAFDADVEACVQHEFVAARFNAEIYLQRQGKTKYSLRDIWEAFNWTHPNLLAIESLCSLELELEEEVLVPVLEMRNRISASRLKKNKILFISDMYLSSQFLIRILKNYGLYEDGDSIYISNECGCTKSNGELYKYVAEKEKVNFKKWEHYGDNRHSDYEIPRKLGICSHLIKHSYTPYQHQWYISDVSLDFHYRSIMAGLGRAIYHSTTTTAHTALVLDIIAPFYCSLVWRIMKNAEAHRIKRLLFCARDTYIMYQIAQKYRTFFPDIVIDFIYISKQSLYCGNEKAKEDYFRQIGLATTNDNVAIVDVRSTGKTMEFLNDWLSERGYKPVRGYYYELFVRRDQCDYHVNDYYCEANAMYVEHYPQLANLFRWWKIQEQYFPLNTLSRTIDYQIDKNGIAVPVFDVDEKQTAENEQWEVVDIDKWSEEHLRIILEYVDNYIMLGVCKFSDSIFNNIVIQTLTKFFTSPDKLYLYPLTEMYVNNETISGKIIRLPYVKKVPIWNILFRKGSNSSVWGNASRIFSMPDIITRFLRMRHNF